MYNAFKNDHFRGSAFGKRAMGVGRAPGFSSPQIISAVILTRLFSQNKL